ncbi:transposase [Methanocaldococcus sp. 10A]
MILEFEITEGQKNDSPYLKKLLANISDILCVLADKGYASRLNAQLIADKNGKPFIKVKKNTNANTKTKNCPAWKNMVKLQKNHPRKFKSIYRFRAKIEANIHSFKSKLGDTVSCKNYNAILNEICCKVIVYNTIRVIKTKLLLYGGYEYKNNLFTHESNLWFLNLNYKKLYAL